jgi:acyl-CoA ligase (AMP-forming) (exosortase A-associated)
MIVTLADLIKESAAKYPQNIALYYKDATLNYEELYKKVILLGQALLRKGYGKGDRIGVYLPSQLEGVISYFACASVGLVFVPINPSLKAAQVSHILNDCDVKMLVTTSMRFTSLKNEALNLDEVLCVGEEFDEMFDGADRFSDLLILDKDELTAIFYTSGSTGKPKGVMLSHDNMVQGALSVSSYLKHTQNDKILSILPLSFDAGFSQLTTAFSAGAGVVLMNYLMPSDVLKMAAKYQVTAITAVPSLWIKLAGLEWPFEMKKNIRYIATTGGRMPVSVTEVIAQKLPSGDIYLMYGLTEAFRSTYLNPSEVGARPDSIGKAIPNAEILVLRADGSICDNDEVGELIHAGPLVAQGYWDDKEKTAEKFKNLPEKFFPKRQDERVVYSGDMVRRDEQGFIYFVGRTDEMIKTSGFRVSPTEIEEIVMASGLVHEVVAAGVADEELGQVVYIAVSKKQADEKFQKDSLLSYCKSKMPSYMVPKKVFECEIPHNANGKIDRGAVQQKIMSLI